MIPDDGAPFPWGLFCVCASGVFSALVWTLATLFRRREAPPRDAADGSGED